MHCCTGGKATEKPRDDDGDLRNWTWADRPLCAGEWDEMAVRNVFEDWAGVFAVRRHTTTSISIESEIVRTYRE
jgi:hypothetical protein